MSEYVYFRMNKQGEKRQVAQVGKNKFFETDYLLERAAPDKDGILQITHTHLLPQENEFISITEASVITGLSIIELKRLCEQGKVRAKLASGTWMIDRNYL